MAERLETGSYILRSLIKNVDLSPDGEDSSIHITCVEIWEENLYIGTSAGQILHYVKFPPDPNVPDDEPAYILASRQDPVIQPGGQGYIQQIVLLPAVGKCCVLSNNTLTFFTLPELSPVSLSKTHINCGWLGGLDLDAEATKDNAVVMLCLRRWLRLVRIGETATKLRDIEFAGCLTTLRRGNFTCVADSRSYALLDVEHQQKIPLFNINTTDDGAPDNSPSLADDLSVGSGSMSRALSPIMHEERGHRKSSSLNLFRKDGETAMGQDLLKPSGSRYGFDTPESRRSTSRRVSTTDIVPPHSPRPELSKPLPPPPPGSRPGSTSPTKNFHHLKPLIASPNSELFLLITGTGPNEPSVGMFVNLDGDVDRGTIDFPNYPEAVVTDGKGYDMSGSVINEDLQEEGFVLALVRRKTTTGTRRDIEIQRWDVEAGEGVAKKEWLNLSSQESESEDQKVGLRALNNKFPITMKEVAERLSLTPTHFHTSSKAKKTTNEKREKDEVHFIQSKCTFKAHLTLWRGREIFWLFRNPTVLQLDARLRLAQATSIEPDALIAPQRELVEIVFNDVRDARANNPLDFLSLQYIRQKSALLLFMHLLLEAMNGNMLSERDQRYTEDALIKSDLDPRVVLSLLPLTKQEIQQAPDGVWIQGGLRQLLDTFTQQYESQTISKKLVGPYLEHLLVVAVRFLLYWRTKKDHPSVVDGSHVAPTVDAALLHVLLVLDSNTPAGPATPGSLRHELYSVVDNGVDCFDRAKQLLEEFKRLYVLSRLYQKRKSTSMVLATWKRILNGEEDVGGEFVDGEAEVRKYLSKLRDKALVIEYATWLAKRNPKLGVQVFADENSRVVIPTAEALLILRENAPNAVKDYLEYLVFGKKQPQHINELIAYYLDIVLSELKSNPRSGVVLSDTYKTYRALKPPKPTYRQFITDNAIDAEWWHSRLRLLHLLGSSQGPASSYDVLAILTRLQPFVHELVPEMIILNGRQGRHKEALHLLTHGLGDFDTAISYCLLGGSSIFRPPTGFVPEDSLPTRDEQAALFKFLLLEFLEIEDVDDRIERTGELLERFGPWFDPAYVLGLLPDDWAIDVFSLFLVNCLQRLVRERKETVMTKALSMAQNLKVNDEFIDKAREAGPFIVMEDSAP